VAVVAGKREGDLYQREGSGSLTIQLAYSEGMGLLCASSSMMFQMSLMFWNDLQHKGQASCLAFCISCGVWKFSLRGKGGSCLAFCIFCRCSRVWEGGGVEFMASCKAPRNLLLEG